MTANVVKTQAKIAARKQLYYAIANGFWDQIEYLRKLTKAVETMREMDVPQDVKASMIQELMQAMMPLYRTSVALKNYQDAFGEFPEFAKFLRFMLKDEHQDDMRGVLDNLIQQCYAAEKTFSGKVLVKRTFDEVAFGKDFITQCTEVKLKGEE